MIPLRFSHDSCHWQAPAAKQKSSKWRGHSAAVLSNDQFRCCVLKDGGVISYLGFVDVHGRAGTNALWEAPWWNEVPHKSTDEELTRSYGDLGTGRFLRNFTGHALCLDSFGPASEAAVAAGSGLHGEASIVAWDLQIRDTNHLSARTHLPFANLNVERNFELIGNEAVLRVRETVTPLEPVQRGIHWVQHVTVGTPLFGPTSRVSTSAQVGITCREAYEGGDSLAEGRGFVWPHAPMADGGSVDLSKLFARPRTGFLVALRQADEARYGFVAVTDKVQGNSLIYVFRSSDFPWLTLWEENRCREEYPWNGDVQARGLEFGTTPWPSGNEVNDAAGPLLDTPTSRVVRAGEVAIAPWIATLVTTPGHWDSLDRVVVEKDQLLLCNGADRLSVRAEGVQAFLDGMERVA